MSKLLFSAQALVFASALLGSLHALALPVAAPTPTFGNSGASDASVKVAEGQIALRSGQIELADKAFREANRVNPRSLEALLGLAMVAQLQGKSVLAQEWMSSAVGVAPDNPGVLKAQARLLIDLGKRELAEASYQRAVRAHSGVPQLRLDYAIFCLEELGKPKDAIILSREVLRQNPEDAAASLILGQAYLATGQLEEATKALEQSVRKDGANPIAFHALGQVLLRRGQAEPALAAFYKALALRSDFLAAMLGRGDALAALGRSEEALSVYQRASELAPRSALPHALRAQLLERLKRTEEAESSYRAALAVEPANTLLLNNLAALLAARRSSLDEAYQFASRAVAADPKRASFIDTLGSVQLARGNLADARKSFEEASSLEPSNLVFKRHLEQARAGVATPTGNMSGAGMPPKPAVLPPPEQKAPVVALKPSPERPDPSKAPGIAIPDLERQLGPQLDAWRQAWESKDAGRYLTYYGNGFAPADKRSRAAWEKDRRAKLDKPGVIVVEIARPTYSVKGEVASVVFEQRYRSSNFQDNVRKQIDWVREGKDWRIVREISL